MKCEDLEGFVDAYIDGEFSDLEAAEVEVHLSECEACQTRVAEHLALKATVKRHAGAIRAPEDLAERVEAALRHCPAATEPDPLFEHALASTPRPRWMTTAPLFASAAFLAGFVWFTSGGFDGDPVVEDAVAKHARALPIEVASQDVRGLKRWLQGKVDFNADLPAFAPPLRPLGARLSHIRDRQAVYVVYRDARDPARRVGLFVFTGPDVEVDGLHRRIRFPRGDSREIVLTNKKGYTVAVWKQDELVYSLVGDMDEAAVLQMIEAAH
ncbi:MAG: hypothetical protein D6729_19315 [Deltaproteobacteria bacterium]|nr:MAG: hypothetical protein D6729_19315 [Deltaproteobacteria bacterium]